MCEKCVHRSVCTKLLAFGDHLQNCLDFKEELNGEWIAKDVMVRSITAKNYTCSVCGIEGTCTPFCPNCGARMCKDSSSKKTGKWQFWSGWVGNHDQRIEDAVCSECGYKHATVRRSAGDTAQDVLNKLSATCPRCHASMEVSY